MRYAENYARYYLENPNPFQRFFIYLLTQKARALGQTSHKIWSLKFIVENYLSHQQNIKVLDCGAWNGWFLSYQSPSIAQRVALDIDPYFAKQIQAEGIQFLLADLNEKYLPFHENTFHLVSITSTIEHLREPECIAKEIFRILLPGGLVFVTTPDIKKYKFAFWDDITHRRPFTSSSLKFLFESTGFHTIEIGPYNHNLFIAGNLFPRWIHRRLMHFRGKAVYYIGEKRV